jgi:hypothetical protein
MLERGCGENQKLWWSSRWVDGCGFGGAVSGQRSSDEIETSSQPAESRYQHLIGETSGIARHTGSQRHLIDPEQPGNEVRIWQSSNKTKRNIQSARSLLATAVADAVASKGEG